MDDEQLAVLRVLVDRRRSMSDHTRMISQLHHLLLELISGGAKKDLSAAQATRCGTIRKRLSHDPDARPHDGQRARRRLQRPERLPRR